jgi:hypothetical protein
MTTSAKSRRTFLAGSAVAVGGLAMAGRLGLAAAPKVLTGASVRHLEPGHGYAAAGETISLYILDLPRPPGDTG